MKKLLLLFVSFFSISSILFAQTYATEELRLREEQHIKEKNARLGISEEKKTESVAIEKEKKEPLSDSFFDGMYHLAGIEALDINHRHSEQEMKAFNAEMQEEFELNDIYVSKDLSKIIYVSKVNKSNYSIQLLELNQEKMLTIKDCKSCQDGVFKIIEQVNGTLKLALKPQDEGHFYQILFTLKTAV